MSRFLRQWPIIPGLALCVWSALFANGCAHNQPTAQVLEIERLGGLAGVGSANSRLRSHGQIDVATLAPADRQSVESLFATPPSDPPHPDEFRYRLTRATDHGPQTIEVPEDRVPPAVRSAVTDQLR